MTPGIGTLHVRAESGPGVGRGHEARMATLATAWERAGGKLGGTAAGAAEPDWIALDGYHLDPSVIEAGPNVLVVDDHGRIGSYARADLVLDQNLEATAAPYGGVPCLLGPRYALVGRKFVGLAERDRVRRARTVLVTLGGDPDPARLARVADAVEAAGFEVLTAAGRDDLAALVAQADLAVSAAGTTTWELCAAGVTGVLVALVDNQEPVAEAMSRAGAFVTGSAADERAIAAAVRDLARDEARHHQMAERVRRICDGRGADRVVVAMRAHDLPLRTVVAEDARLLWEWTNEPAVRAASFISAPIPWDDHLAWFTARLDDSRTRMYIGSDPDGTPLGQARFRLDGADGEIGVSLDARTRGRGLGPVLIRAATSRLFGDSGVQRVHAWIRTDNEPSRRAFSLAGYQLDRDALHSSGAAAVVMVMDR